MSRLIRGSIGLMLLARCASTVGAQGVSTSGISGRVTTLDGSVLDAHVRVVDEANGFAVEARPTGGRFLVQGLEPGGPYTLTVRAVGYEPARLDRVQLALGEIRDVKVTMRPIVARLDTMATVARAGAASRLGAGAGTTLPDSLLERLPTLDRDLYDFLRLVPQLSMKIGLASPGISAAGMNFRLNDFLINGVSERTVSGGVSPAFSGLKSVPLDAVREYQVLLAPYDVRYGNFVGALVNTVTKSGTNELAGSVFAYARSERLARRNGLTTATPYEHAQYGFSLGGPIVRDRVHFFLAPELQHFTYPASGPYVGQPVNAQPAIPVNAADIQRFSELMQSYGLTAGSAGPIEIGHPLRNVFARLDVALPSRNSRLAVWGNWSGGEDVAFSRASRDTFSLSSYEVTRDSRARAVAVDLHTVLSRAGGGHNELLVSRRVEGLDPTGAVEQPIVRVSVPSTSGGRITFNTGTHETAQRASFRSETYSLRDDVTLPFGANHVLTLGARLEGFRLRRENGVGSYGTWSFASLDDLAAGIADRYEVRVGYESTQAELRGAQYAAYLGDRWQPSQQFSLVGGLRADLMAIRGHAPSQPLVDSLFGRRTDRPPRRRVELSPRLGFDWDLTGSGRHRVRGGLGMFTGPYPLAWVQSALSSYGAASGVLRCAATGGPPRQPPPFTPDFRAAPTTCGGGTSLGSSFRGDVNLLDPGLRMARVARGSLAYEWQLPRQWLLTNEALVNRSLSDFVFVNLNLPEAQGTDKDGRVLYGTIAPSGIATIRPRSDFSEVVDLRNTTSNRSYVVATRVETTRPTGVGGFASYSYSRVRDVQTPLRVNTRGTLAWASARVVSGRHDDLSVSRSSNDIPHRVVVAGTYTAPWRRAPTVFAFYYVGESGRPFTYVATGTLGRGDLNADGSNVDDPIYVPRDAMDTTEIGFSGESAAANADNSTEAQALRERAQREAFQARIDRTACLRRQRGRILERNSCREPWSNLTIASLRQAIPVGHRMLEAQLDVSNVLNLLNPRWGQAREAAPALLEHVGQLADATRGSRPVFRFDATAADWTTAPETSAFQLQVAARYRF